MVKDDSFRGLEDGDLKDDTGLIEPEQEFMGPEEPSNPYLNYIKENNDFDVEDINRNNTVIFPENEWKLAEIFSSGEAENAVVKTGVMMGYIVCANAEEENFVPVTYESIDYPEAAISGCWLLQIDKDSDTQKQEIPKTVSSLFEEMEK